MFRQWVRPKFSLLSCSLKPYCCCGCLYVIDGCHFEVACCSFSLSCAFTCLFFCTSAQQSQNQEMRQSLQSLLLMSYWRRILLRLIVWRIPWREQSERAQQPIHWRKKSGKNTYTIVTKRSIRVAIPTSLRFTVKNTWASDSQAV